jgi:hypothetical protein
MYAAPYIPQHPEQAASQYYQQPTLAPAQFSITTLPLPSAPPAPAPPNPTAEALERWLRVAYGGADKPSSGDRASTAKRLSAVNKLRAIVIDPAHAPYLKSYGSFLDSAVPCSSNDFVNRFLFGR